MKLLFSIVFVGVLIGGRPELAAAQSAPSPAPSTAPAAPAGAIDENDLTPAQAEALRLAIIKTSQNPVGNITVLPFQSNWNSGVGPYARFQYNLNVQPVVPIMLSPSLTLIARTILPVLDQPSAAPPAVCASSFGCGSTFGIGDVQEQLFFAPKTKPNQLIWGVGPILQFPTATPGALGSGQYAAGPDAVALIMPGKFVVGALVTQVWSYAGAANRPGVNNFLVQPFVNFNLKNGWAISTAPSITADWNALPSNRWTVPVGGSIGRTFKADGQLMSLSVAWYSFVVRPVGAPQTQVRVQWSLLWPVKRGIDIRQLIQEGE